MIISHQRKVILFSLPRTGTMTLRTAARNANGKFDHISYNHYNYDELRENVKGRDNFGFGSTSNLDSYEMYTFYRDPFDRLKSGLNLLRRGRLHSRTIHAFYGWKYPVSCASRVDYNELHPELQRAIDAIPYYENFKRLKWFWNGGPMGRGHFGFIEGPVQALPFSDFDNSARRVLARLGTPITGPLPQVGSAPYDPEKDRLSPTEEKAIKDYFAPDYEYLDKKGIHFTR